MLFRDFCVFLGLFPNEGPENPSPASLRKASAPHQCLPGSEGGAPPNCGSSGRGPALSGRVFSILSGRILLSEPLGPRPKRRNPEGNNAKPTGYLINSQKITLWRLLWLSSNQRHLLSSLWRLFVSESFTFIIYFPPFPLLRFTSPGIIRKNKGDSFTVKIQKHIMLLFRIHSTAKRVLCTINCLPET